MINYKTILTVRTNISTKMGAQIDNFDYLIGDLLRFTNDHIESREYGEVITEEDLKTVQRVIQFLKENNTKEIDCVSWDELDE